jgi:PAS domain S-box-containing protein
MSEEIFDQGEHFFQELADNAPVMIWRSGADRLCDWFNKPWLDFVGRTMERELGNGWVENVHADDVDRCLKIYVSSFDARKPFSMVYRLRRSDGVYREILANGAPFYRAAIFAGYFGSCIDVTDQRLAEEQLRQAQKLEAIGQLTGGIAHDFNNLLTVIVTNLHLASEQAGATTAAAPFLHAAQEAAESGASLIRQLLTFARRQHLNPRSVDLARLIHGLEEMLQRILGPEIRLVIAAAPDAAPTYADPNQIELAILNLTLNARDAMPKGGSVRVAVENRRADRGSPLALAPGGYVVVSVSDDGIGMDEATFARAFEPFFTTKEVGRGSGLGLPMVQGFAAQSGGSVRIFSELGKGTTVELWLPRADKPARAAEA